MDTDLRLIVNHNLLAMPEDYKLFVKDSYLHIIKGVLDRIARFQTDSLMNELIRLFIKIPEASDQNADEILLATDKFFLYRKIWQGILETLYEKYLPHMKYEFRWIIEITPYTMMLSQLSRGFFNGQEIEMQKQILKIEDKQIEEKFESLIETLGFEGAGLKRGVESFLPATLVPQTRKEQLILLFRLMNYPPLGELALFVHRYNTLIKKQAKDLSIAFPGVEEEKIPTIGMQESLHCSWFHIDHELFEKYGLKEFQKHPELQDFKGHFEEIHKVVKQQKGKFKDKFICPCCGKEMNVLIPGKILQYKYLLENQELSKKIGLLYLKDYTENYKAQITEKFISFLPNLNRVDNPRCLILVEGESEERAIPLLAFRRQFFLSQHDIQVFNAKSKEKLEAEFMSRRANYPNLKIICLLDSDAMKEKENIERIVKKNKNKYKLVFIEKGTFEDIFDLNFSIKIINKLYPEGERITKEDFDSSKDFLSNVNRILFHKKRARFDKVLFAEMAALKVNRRRMPKEITEILKVAKLFTKPGKYIKR